MGERRGMKALELWAKRVTDGYPGVKVDNMTTSWRDGLAFCALIHHFRPDLIDFDRLDKRDILKNNELAFRVAERQLGIPALLDAEDMVEYEIPDRLSILTYLSQFYQVFAQQGSSPSPKKHTSSVTDILSPASNNAGVKVGRGRVERCYTCDRPVFLAERLLVGGKLRHRSCFMCARCGHLLNPVSCYETETGDFVCEMCPDENVKRRESLPANDSAPPAETAPKLPELPPPVEDDMAETSLSPPANLPPLTPDSDGPLPIKPPDPSKEKFFQDILDGEKTELSSDSGLSEAPYSFISNRLDKTNLTTVSLDSDNILEDNAQTEGEIRIIDEESQLEQDGEETTVLKQEEEEVSLDKLTIVTTDAQELEKLTENLEIGSCVEENSNEPEAPSSAVEELAPAVDSTKEEEVKNEDSINEPIEAMNIPIHDDQPEESSLEKIPPAPAPRVKVEKIVPSPRTRKNKENAQAVKEAITVTITEDYPSDLNPFGSEEEEEENSPVKNPFDESDDEEPAKPVPSPRTCRKVEVNAEGKTVVEAPKNLNPFWSGSEDEEEDAPMAAPRRLTLTPEPLSRNQFGSSTSLGSQNSSVGKKKKRPAPPPPTEVLLRRPSSPVSSLSSPSGYASRSPISSRRRKSRAPLPPVPPSEKERKEQENAAKKNNQLSPPSDKSTYGKWKRKKGAAPGLPIPPQRRRIVVMPLGDLNQEFEDLEVQQTELERQGVKLEQTIRKIEEGGEEENGAVGSERDIEEMVLQLFEIVNQKNELFRRQAELMFLRKQQRLEGEHADIEYQIRCLMGRPKDQADPALEEELIRRLVEVVERRNEIIECLDMNRKRAVEEDQSIHDTLMAFTARDAINMDSTTEEESPVVKKSSKSVLKLLKKKRERKKEKKVLEKKKNDADVDIDESVPVEVIEKKSKKKWFKLEK